MIVHNIGSDTREAFAWYDDDELIVAIDDTDWSVLDAEGETVAVGTVSVTEDVVYVHIADDAAITTGIYLYALRALSGPDWRYLGAGLLRVR